MKDSPKILHKTITKHLVNVSKITTYQARRMWGGRGGPCPPTFWQISLPYLNQGGGLIIPTQY